MKKYLILLFLLVGNILSAQSENYTRLSGYTYMSWTADMVWNYTTQEWDFINRDDRGEKYVEWGFLVNKFNNTGTIKAGTVGYDILDYRTEVKDGMKLVIFEVYNAQLGRKMTFILTQDGVDTFIAIYDNVGRAAYYFD